MGGRGDEEHAGGLVGSILRTSDARPFGKGREGKGKERERKERRIVPEGGRFVNKGGR